MRLHRLHGGRGFKLQPAGCQELKGSTLNYAHWIQGAKEQPIVPKRAIPILSINPELSLNIPHYGSYQVAVRRGATASAAGGAAGAAIFSLRGGDLCGRLARENVVFTRRRQDYSASMNLPRVPAHVTVHVASMPGSSTSSVRALGGALSCCFGRSGSRRPGRTSVWTVLEELNLDCHDMDTTP